mgnify:CR=1 FL=1
MSFPHENAVVADIIHTSKQVAEEMAKLPIMAAPLPPTFHSVLIDGLFFSKGVAELLLAVKKKYPTIKVGVNKCREMWRPTLMGDGTRVFSEAWLYYPNQVMAIMRVGFGDYMITRTTKDAYAVFSRCIRNSKVNSSRAQYHMAMSEKLDIAMKSVQRYMLPYRPVELAALSVDQFVDAANSPRDNASRAAYAAWRDVADDSEGRSALRAELRHMLATGYEFVSPVLREHVAKWVEADELFKQKDGRKIGASYNRIFLDALGVQMVERISWDDATTLGPHSIMKPHLQPPVPPVKLSELSEEMLSKISMLTMLDPGVHVEHVGMRVNDTIFWVEHDE